jgi:hypothetical protein
MLNVLLFIIIFLAGIFLTILVNPVFSFALYEVTYFFNPQVRWWGHFVPDVSYSYYVVLFMIGSLAVNYKKLNNNKVFSAPQFKWIYMILVIVFLTSFIAVYPEYHSQQLEYFFKLVIIITVAYKLIDTEADLNYVQWAYIFGCWYLSFMAFQIGRNAGDRIVGIGTVDALDTNGVAAAIAPSIILCLYFYWISEHKWRKFCFALAGVFIANALILINSRGAFLALVGGLLYFMYFMYFSSMQKKFQKATVVWITIAGLSGALYLADKSFLQRVVSISNNQVNEQVETGATRIEFWKGAWEMAQDFPLGAGINGFQYYSPIYLPEDINTGGSRNRAVHSTWFEALSEFGYLGLFLLIMMLRACFKVTAQCKNLFKKEKDINRYFQILALEAALLSFLISMTFINRFRAEIFYWLILFTACAYNIYIVKPNKEKKKND